MEPVVASEQRNLSASARLADLAVESVHMAPVALAFEDILAGLRSALDVADALVRFIPEVHAVFPPLTQSAGTARAADTTLCDQVIAGRAAMEIEDLTADPACAGLPFVQGPPGLRFYSGVPLLSDSGRVLGALCVVDTRARRLSDREHVVLRSAAYQVTVQLELRRALESALRSERYRARLNLLATRDFRTSLTTITTVLGELDQFSHQDAERSLIALAVDAADTLEADFRRVAEATELSADRDSPPVESRPLHGILQDLVHLWDHRVRSQGGAIDIESVERDLVTNAPLLLRVLDSLVSVVAAQGARRIRVHAAADGPDLLIRVEARELRGSLGESASRGVAEDLAQLNPNGSLGLGLSIAKRTCDVLGYRLTMARDAATGCMFTVRVASGMPRSD